MKGIERRDSRKREGKKEGRENETVKGRERYTYFATHTHRQRERERERKRERERE